MGEYCICCLGKHDSADVIEIVNSHEIHEPGWRPRLVARLPGILDSAARCSNRGHCLSLDASAANEPACAEPNDKHKHDQPAHTYSQEPPPGTRGGFGLIGHAGLWRAACR